MQLEELQQWIKNNLLDKTNGLNSSKLNPKKSFVNKKETQFYINEIIRGIYKRFRIQLWFNNL